MSDTLILNKDGQPLSLLPLSVVPWQTAIRLLSIDKVFVLEEYDDWEVHSVSVTMKVPSIVMTTEFVKWKKGAKFNRSNVYLRDDFTCQLCEESTPLTDLTYDHVLPRHKGGKTHWENIIAACRDCNSRKGHDETFVVRKLPEKPNYFQLVAKRKKYPIQISDEKWKMYLDWPEDLYRLKGINKHST